MQSIVSTVGSRTPLACTPPSGLSTISRQVISSAPLGKIFATGAADRRPTSTTSLHASSSVAETLLAIAVVIAIVLPRTRAGRTDFSGCQRRRAIHDDEKRGLRRCLRTNCEQRVP